MNYKMKVKITDPNTAEGMISELFFVLDVNFEYDKDQYGNGHYVSIGGKDFYPQSFDLRYDKTFDRNNKLLWLMQWATNYWKGKDGAWKIKSIEFEVV